MSSWGSRSDNPGSKAIKKSASSRAGGFCLSPCCLCAQLNAHSCCCAVEFKNELEKPSNTFILFIKDLKFTYRCKCLVVYLYVYMSCMPSLYLHKKNSQILRVWCKKLFQFLRQITVLYVVSGGTEQL